jgi:hypothetical protein
VPAATSAARGAGRWLVVPGGASRTGALVVFGARLRGAVGVRASGGGRCAAGGRWQAPVASFACACALRSEEVGSTGRLGEESSEMTWRGWDREIDAREPSRESELGQCSGLVGSWGRAAERARWLQEAVEERGSGDAEQRRGMRGRGFDQRGQAGFSQCSGFSRSEVRL